MLSGLGREHRARQGTDAIRAGRAGQGIQGRANSVSGDSVADLEEGDHHGVPAFAYPDKTAHTCITLLSCIHWQDHHAVHVVGCLQTVTQTSEVILSGVNKCSLSHITANTSPMQTQHSMQSSCSNVQYNLQHI